MSALNRVPGNQDNSTPARFGLHKQRDYTQQKGCYFTSAFDHSRETPGMYKPTLESPMHEINCKDSEKTSKQTRNSVKTLIKPLFSLSKKE